MAPEPAPWGATEQDAKAAMKTAWHGRTADERLWRTSWGLALEALEAGLYNTAVSHAATMTYVIHLEMKRRTRDFAVSQG